MGAGRGAKRRTQTGKQQPTEFTSGCLALFKPRSDSLEADFKRIAVREDPPSILVGRHCIIQGGSCLVRNWRGKETRCYDVIFPAQEEKKYSSLKQVPEHDLVFVSSTVPQDPDVADVLAPIMELEPVGF